MKILFTGVYSCFHGGLERFAERAKAALEEAGHTVDVAGDPPGDAGGYDYVLMQKIPPTVEALRRLKTQCGEKLHFFAHDHDAYCLRRHYYDPFKRNCDRMYSFFPCRFCAAVTRPQWVKRALTRDILGFQRELSEVKAFAPSNYTRRKLIECGFPAERVRTVYPLFGVFHEEPHVWMPEGRLRILFMGQLVAGKGVRVLIEAMHHLKAPATLTVVGTGRDEAMLRRIAADGGADVVFTGWQENAQRFFKDTDVCCMPSLWNEPFGLSGTEGFTHGVPAVAFDVGGTPDWLKPGETGYFPEKDGETRTAKARNPVSLAAALDRCADPKRLAELGANAFALAQKLFDRGNFLRALLD